MKKTFTYIVLLLFATATFAQKKVLIEHFSNASCSTCGTYSPQVFAFAEQNKDNVIVISYHTPFPYLHDSLHFDNEAANNARINYYGVPGTPYTILEGNYDKGPASVMVGKLGTKRDERIANAPAEQPEIMIFNAKLENGMVTAEVHFFGADAIKDKDLRGHIALLEKEVPKTAYVSSPGTNSEQVYKNVMRQMYMPQTGYTLLNKASGTGDVVNISLPITNVKNIKQLRLVAFVQDNDSKEVHQASAKDITDGTTSIATVTNTETVWSYNPVAKNYLLTLSQAQTGTITITDITGKQISTINVTNEAQKTVETNQLNSGIYIATFSNGNIQIATKLLVE